MRLPNKRQTDIALSAAKRGYGRYQLGAVIFRGNEVVSIGWNKSKTHPEFGNSWSNKIHAEADAIIKALKQKCDLTKCSMLVVRAGWNLAKPCSCCSHMIASHGIKNVFYTTSMDIIKHQTN